uniref:Uncharacterized protein n=1 Tax=viral metagenome TaxID=1070528 RepID=A0A6C0E9D2_9ZZZZ
MIRREDIEGSKYKYIYDKGLPDKDLEFFWYGFCDSINNTIKSQTENIPHGISELVNSKLESTKKTLNQLQKEEKYNTIQTVINDFIVWIGKNIMIRYANSYHFSIYVTNIKRWALWILHANEGLKISFDILTEKNINLAEDHFTVFLELKTQLVTKSTVKANTDPTESELLNLISKYETEKPSNNLTILHSIAELLMTSNYLKPTLLDALSSVCPIIDYLKKYKKIPSDLVINKPYSLEKIIKKHLITTS